MLIFCKGPTYILYVNSVFAENRLHNKVNDNGNIITETLMSVTLQVFVQKSCYFYMYS